MKTYGPLMTTSASPRTTAAKTAPAATNRARTPAALRPPFARYSHAVEVQAGSRMVFASGQLGARPDDSIPEGAEAQADLCFGNIRLILEDAGMTLADIVRINAYVTDRAHMAGYMAARDRHAGTPPPAAPAHMGQPFQSCLKPRLIPTAPSTDLCP